VGLERGAEPGVLQTGVGFGHQLLGHGEHTSRSRYRNEIPQGMSMSEQRNIGVGLVGAEFIEPYHIEALQRLGGR
jgi:hypothetical protein